MFFNNLILIFEFIYIKWKALLGNTIAAILLCSLVLFSEIKFDVSLFEKLTSNSINLLGILLGFTASIFTVILTIDNDVIKESKRKMLEGRFYNREFTLYDSLVINFAFLIILQGFLLIVNFISPVFNLNNSGLKFFLLVDLISITLMILLLVNAILEFYFIITKKEQ
ncbi:hypothetical protein FW781_07045 (plasmid) [Chryseobacterium panacisoli]|uniref:Uncharacterized protein n=1 Tax=Chryseobacterium panacisoli TaxID=1807141 RepID=A0A5D8ZY77_9FLAO|nr:hypothetical protein [Chryseobacterium panacisoli]TZF99679.1 hypothetical protein FW781_07045 [Chryseobacterium panacisoli]